MRTAFRIADASAQYGRAVRERGNRAFWKMANMLDPEKRMDRDKLQKVKQATGAVAATVVGTAFLAPSWAMQWTRTKARCIVERTETAVQMIFSTQGWER